jgi:hypothetical protein
MPSSDNASRISRKKAHLILDYLIDAFQGVDEDSLKKPFETVAEDLDVHIYELLTILQPATGSLQREPSLMRRQKRNEIEHFKISRSLAFYILMKIEGYPRRGAKASAIKKVSAELGLDEKTIERWGYPPPVYRQPVDLVFKRQARASDPGVLEKWTLEHVMADLKLNHSKVHSRIGTSNR